MEPTPERHQGGHVIVCGLAGVGLRIVELLHLSGVPVTVVDNDASELSSRQIAGWGIPLIRGSAHVGDGFHEARLDEAAAVICVDSDEIRTLESALRIRELRADVRIVVRLANPSVAQALARVLGADSVLDVATLAGPSFVEACLRNTVHRIELGGVEFAVVQVTVAASDHGHATFRGRYGSLAPVAIVPGPGGEVVPCPGRDHPVAAGDRVAVLGTVEELQRDGIDVRSGPHAPLRSIGIATRISRTVRQIIREGNKALAIVVVALVVLGVTSTIVLRLTYRPVDGHGHLSVLNAAYFTVETVATVGYGDFSFASQTPWMRVFAIALIIVGVALVSTAFALFTNLLVSRRIEQSLGRLEVPGMVDHVVVIGLGSVGIKVIQGLVAAGQRVVAIDRDGDNRYLAQARALGVPVIIADGTLQQTHRMVNLHEAASVAVLTSADLTNIETGLAIRESLGERWEMVPVVLRVFDRNLARMMADSFGFGFVRSTADLAAPWFVGAALGLHVLSTFNVDQQPFIVGRLSIAPEGGLQCLAMGDLSSRTRVIALSRAALAGALEHPPRRATRFAGGDEAYLLGPYEELLQVLRRDQTLSR